MQTEKASYYKELCFLAFAALVLLLVFAQPDGAGYSQGCSLISRYTYPLYHASVFHAIVNLIVLRQCLKCYKADCNIIAFYLIAVSYPFPSDKPIMGLSGVIYAYMAYIAPLVSNKLKYNLTIAAYLAVGFLVPGMAAGVHLYCYALGLLWGYLNQPICKDE